MAATGSLSPSACAHEDFSGNPSLPRTPRASGVPCLDSLPWPWVGKNIKEIKYQWRKLLWDFSLRLSHKSAKGESSAESQECSPLLLGVLHGTAPPVESQAEPWAGTGVCQLLPGQAGQPGKNFQRQGFHTQPLEQLRRGSQGRQGLPSAPAQQRGAAPQTPQQHCLHPQGGHTCPKTELLDVVQRTMLIMPGSDPCTGRKSRNVTPEPRQGE